MLGVGRLVKELGYIAKINMRKDPWHRLLANVAPNYREYRRLFRMSNDVVVSPEHKYLYVANLKAASTSVRNRLWELEGNPPLNDPTDIWEKRGGLTYLRDINKETTLSAFSDPDWFRFSIVRNPFSRVVSAYRFLLPRLPDPAHGSGKFKFGPSQHRWHPDFNNAMSFEKFVHIACCEDRYWRDPHLHRQVDLLRIPSISYDFIGKTEQISEDLTKILERLNAPAWLVDRSGMKDNASSQAIKAGEWFTNDLADDVRQYYADDFSVLGYSRDLPD